MKPAVLLILLLTLIGPPGLILGEEVEVGEPSGPLDDLGTELDFSFSYLHFTDLDMDKTYSYLPTFGVGVSFLIAPDLRTFLAVGYGQKSGDPYYGVPGFEGGHEITVKTVPFQMGLKVNLAHSSRIRVQMGLAFMLAYTREEGIPHLDNNGHIDSSPASDILGGIQLTFAPEWLISGDSRILGLEMGYGGTRGTINGGSYSHEIDLTGFSGRAYLAFGL